MRKQVNLQNLQAVKNYILGSDEYNFEKFLANAGVLDTFVPSGDELKGCCLLHPERNPSASFNDKKGIWGCFSCGCGGDYIELVRLTSGKNVGYFHTAEKLLKSDKKMQLMLGVSSIFDSVEEQRDFKPLAKPVAKFKETTGILSYMDLAERMKGCSLEEAKIAILFMQKGLPVEDVLRVWTGTEAYGMVLDLEGI